MKGFGFKGLRSKCREEEEAKLIRVSETLGFPSRNHPPPVKKG